MIAEELQKKYEIVAIFAGTETEDKAKEGFLRIRKLIEDENGKINEDKWWGKKALAYPIKKQDHGYYGILNFDLTPKDLKKISIELNLLDSLIRYLIVLAPEIEKKVVPQKKGARSEDKNEAQKSEQAIEPPLAEKVGAEKTTCDFDEKNELDKKLDELLKE